MKPKNVHKHVNNVRFDRRRHRYLSFRCLLWLNVLLTRSLSQRKITKECIFYNSGVIFIAVLISLLNLFHGQYLLVAALNEAVPNELVMQRYTFVNDLYC